MCQDCVDRILTALGKMRSSLTTAESEDFTIISAGVGSIVFRVESTGKERWIDTGHIGEVYHVMAFNEQVVRGVGSGKHSVRSLVGATGALATCGVCERNPAYIWGILAAMPEVVREGTSLRVEKAHQN